MSRRYTIAIWLAFLLLWFSTSARAEQLHMIRVNRAFPETMTDLQQAIKDHGYTVARVQRVDVGLHASGFKTAEYRVVFFGKTEEIRDLSHRFPSLIPYLPWQIVIFAEGEDTLVIAGSPLNLSRFVEHIEARKRLAIWEQDILAIFDQVRQGGAPAAASSRAGH